MPVCRRARQYVDRDAALLAVMVAACIILCLTVVAEGWLLVTVSEPVLIRSSPLKSDKMT